jgi:hypothetical protein
MELSQENSLCSCLYFKPAKTSIFFIFYVFSSTEIENRRAEQVLPGWEGAGIGTSGRGKVARKGVGG